MKRISKNEILNTLLNNAPAIARRRGIDHKYIAGPIVDANDFTDLLWYLEAEFNVDKDDAATGLTIYQKAHGTSELFVAVNEENRNVSVSLFQEC